MSNSAYDEQQNESQNQYGGKNVIVHSLIEIHRFNVSYRRSSDKYVFVWTG